MADMDKESVQLSPSVTNDAEDPSAVHQSQPSLKATMSLTDGICIIVGIIIGSGIFSSPGVAMSEAGTAQVC